MEAVEPIQPSPVEAEGRRPRPGPSPRVLAAALAVIASFMIVGGLTAAAVSDDQPQQAGNHSATLGARVAQAAVLEPTPRTVDAYAGLGTWVDVFDYAPGYQGEGHTPSVTPDDIDAMAEGGIETLYLQAARHDDEFVGLVDDTLVTEFVVRAHRARIDVVAWYLPTFADVEADADEIEALIAYDYLGHRFDGVALDIEYINSVPDVTRRNGRLMRLSAKVDAAAGEMPVGAIVLPPVQIEIVGTEFWPHFPWQSISPHYDIWLPMSYWTFRNTDSEWYSGYTYNETSTRLLRENIDDPDALVHGIGGIGDTATPAQYSDFVDSLVDTESIGGSIYDWNTLTAEGRDLLEASFSDGAGASLRRP
ncbi:MAG: hypothetical protein GY713_19010 [Actinomycetia bacterium]|nr:hypothetical protein [Actinomycetes bacterium]